MLLHRIEQEIEWRVLRNDFFPEQFVIIDNEVFETNAVVTTPKIKCISKRKPTRPMVSATQVLFRSNPVLSEKTAVLKEISVMRSETTPMLSERTSLPREIAPTISKATPVLREKPPTVRERPPTERERPPTVKEKPPTVRERPPTVKEKPPTVREEDSISTTLLPSLKKEQVKNQLSSKEYDLVFFTTVEMFGKTVGEKSDITCRHCRSA